MNSVARTAGSSAPCSIQTLKFLHILREHFVLALAISASGSEGHDRLRRWTQTRANPDRQQYSLHSRFAGTSHRRASRFVWTTSIPARAHRMLNDLQVDSRERTDSGKKLHPVEVLPTSNTTRSRVGLGHRHQRKSAAKCLRVSDHRRDEW